MVEFVEFDVISGFDIICTGKGFNSCESEVSMHLITLDFRNSFPKLKQKLFEFLITNNRNTYLNSLLENKSKNMKKLQNSILQIKLT